MRPPDPRRYRARRPVIAVAGFVCALLLESSPGWGYRFYPSRDEDSVVPRSDAARRWQSTVWGPGDTLVWHLLDDPLWLAHFSGPEEALPLVEESLDAWGRIPSTDVRWRVDGIIVGEQVRGDGRNTVSVEETEDFAGQARRWSRRRLGGPWERVECDVVLGTVYLEKLAGTDDNRLSTLLHELGHCLGLAHAAVTPTVRWNRSWTDSSVWQKDPQMSYGRDIDNTLAEDEAIGASLLRPVRGWLRTTGSISGRVLSDSGPAAFVSVHVLRNNGGRARPAVQVFSNETGEFLTEGLAPGEYLLWIHPMIAQSAHGRLLQRGDPLSDLNDSLELQLLVVRAGRETRAGELTLSHGRVVP